jgi:hypothetical protein
VTGIKKEVKMNNFITKIFLFFVILLCISCRENTVEPIDNSIENNETSSTNSFQKIITPSEGENLNSGNKFTIKWNSKNSKEQLTIELVRKFDYVQTISNSTTNDGEFEWIVPSNLKYNHHFRIKLISKNNSTVYIYSNEFNIE